ncbi:S9 family peptidase [Fulvivirga sp.]|uniref:S9 family peptidase n=1 Tax=Fulvivirga sp. TaxID=1931237 RepID=UPI0032ED9F11
MRHHKLISIFLCLITSCGIKRDIILPYTPEQFSHNKRTSGLSFSSDGSKVLYTSDELGSPAAFYYDLTSKQSVLFHSDSTKPVFSLTFMPQKDTDLIFISNVDGGPISHIYHKSENTSRDLTPGENVIARFYGNTLDNSGFYYLANSRNRKQFDLHQYDFASNQSRLIFKNETDYSIAAVSGDNQYIALHDRITEDITDLYVCTVSNGNLIRISPDENKNRFEGLYFSEDNKELYYLTNRNNEFTFLEKLDLISNTREVVIKENWDIMFVETSNDQNYRVVNINENGSPKIKIQDVVRNTYLNIPILNEIQVTKTKFSPDANKLALQVTDYNTPKDIYILDIHSQKITIAVKSLNPEINENHLIEPTDVTFKSFDGLEIPTFLYKPKATSKKKLPALLWTHGGPGGQFDKTFDEYIQYVANQGYVILAVNNRGSSGYGKTFKSLDNKNHGIGDLKDCLYGKYYLQNLDYVDPDKIGIIGASYGGYLSLAALTFYPDEFAVGIDMFGISNWFNVLNNVPDIWETRKKALFAEMGDPKTDSVMLYSKSPLFYSKQINKPLLVIQGANDEKVPRVQADSMVAKVRENGTPVEYIIFDDEGHGIRKHKNKIESLKAIRTFLDQYLKH